MPGDWQACIDQAGDINASLRALPIFLLASDHFVVLAGETYTRRMWCVLEIFTFVRSGGKVEQIVLKPLKSGSASAAFSAFDIRQADCFLRVDKQRILAVVESSYGSFGQFNAACRQIFSAQLGLTTKTQDKKGSPLTASRGGADEAVNVSV